jgi:TonB-dependent SusC/RagA subfamily outer membrane receptor
MTSAVFILCLVDAGNAFGQQLQRDVSVRTLASSVLHRKAETNVSDVPLTAALSRLAENSGVSLAYSPSLLSAYGQRVDCECSQLSVGDALERMLWPTKFSHSEQNGKIVIALKTPNDRVRPRGRGENIRATDGVSALSVDHASPFDPSELETSVSVQPVQQVGTVAGRVTDAATGYPMASVAVAISALGIQVATDDDGRFTVPGLPVGTHQLSLRRIGYRPETQQVRVSQGGTAEVNVTMIVQALSLDEVVVTGTAGVARRREVGNTISSINFAQAMVAPSMNVEAALQAQAPALNVLQSSGTMGTSSQIRLRGNISVAMTNQPLLYVDGVRVRSEGYPQNSPSGVSNRGANVNPSPLNDINPSDIERIEIIKGAAATTLYGTEAAAGVIQIFTKSGSSGRGRWTAQVDLGADKAPKFGTEEVPYIHMEPWLKTAFRQKYSLSVAGGAETFRYFVSSAYEDNEGVLPLDWEKRAVIRGNFDFEPLQDLQLTWNTSYSSYDVSQTPSGNNAQGLLLNVFRQEKNYLSSAEKEDIDQILNQDVLTNIGHLITGMTATYAPVASFTHRLTVGYDLSNYEGRFLRPFGFVFVPEGILSTTVWTSDVLTVDYTGTLGFGIARELRSSFSWGAQHITTQEFNRQATAEEFPGPSDPTVSSAARSVGYEERIKVVNAGFFAQNVLDFKNRYFLTLGLRVDGNSAFGQDLGLQAYPKASMSYVISDEQFWPQAFGNMKLRFAYGHAGRAPGAFDAVRTWDPVGWAGEVAYYPRNVGNAELGPERTTEIESGFESSLFDGRLTTEFTYYRRKTSDALFDVLQVPSLGFQGGQLENVGEIESKGVELAVQGTVFEKPSFLWDLGATLATNYSKVLDLGGAEPFTVGNLGWIEEGYPVPVIKGHEVLNPDEIADAQLDTARYYGPNLPTHIVGANTAVRFPRGIRLSARGEYQGGHYMYDNGSWSQLRRDVDWPICLNARALQAADRDDELSGWERKWCVPTAVGRNSGPVYPADFFKLREVSLAIPVGFVFPGTDNATLILTGRNVYRWKNKDFLIFDPEMTGNDGSAAMVRVTREFVPAPTTYTVSLRVTF